MVYIKFRPVDLIQLKPGMLAVMRITRPLASDERDEIVKCWQQSVGTAGHPEVPLLILCGLESDLRVLYADNQQINETLDSFEHSKKLIASGRRVGFLEHVDELTRPEPTLPNPNVGIRTGKPLE